MSDVKTLVNRCNWR